MQPLDVAARIACLAAGPLVAAWSVSRKRARGLALTFALGAVAYAPASLVEAWVRRWSGIEDAARGAAVVALVYAFLVVAPLEQGLKVAAFAPVFRAQKRPTPLDGVLLAGAAALGFVTARSGLYLFARQAEGLGAVARAAVAVPAHVFFACAWGYALARDPQRRISGRAFNVAWLAATIFNGVFDNIAFDRRLSALVATVPILACAAIASWLASKDLLAGQPAPSRPSIARRLLPAIAPPSIQAVRAALRRTERPVMLHWIVGGALVTTGVLGSTLAGAVVLGRRIGLDFAAVDRGDAVASATAPLVLLAAAALAAFPFAGYLVAKASAVRSVLEPAIGSALAIAGVLVLLGLAAPLAVVFALAFAPIAFALACAGAWVGMER
ncbi:MAG TPA: PrsW family glutamic-type intramembrane protease [Byssovorax sp.]|jgi:RsiW-degrading membrane proteinase PrsW (M82 family)